ncbi:MAG: tetratricopeptide repeat protein [Methanotrichaceae archaeon]|nr:tetratricopeptide repeat protein [Methanotrichaceae archaeon]
MRSRTGIALGFLTLVLLGNFAVAEEDTADYWMDIAYGLTANGSYEDAVLAYDKVLDIDPDNYNALINKGHALQYWALNSYNRALEITNEILEDDSDDALAWQGKGVALSGLNRQGEDDQAYASAIDVLNRTLEKNPSDGEAWFLKGENYVNMHNAEAALAAYEEVIELNYTQRIKAAWLMKAILLAELQRYDEALSASEMAIDLCPSSASAWMTKGYLLEKLGRHAEADEAFARASGEVL